MGAWGEEIFENDNALDFVGDVIDEYEELIDSILKEKITSDIDYSLDYEGQIGPSIYILNILLSEIHCASPKPEKIKLWQNAFFKEYDKYTIDSWGERVIKKKEGIV